MSEPWAQTEEKLIPCPFCKSDAAPAVLSNREIDEIGDCACECHDCADMNFAVCCRANNGGCGATGGYATSKVLAAKNWNRSVS